MRHAFTSCQSSAKMSQSVGDQRLKASSAVLIKKYGFKVSPSNLPSGTSCTYNSVPSQPVRTAFLPALRDGKIASNVMSIILLLLKCVLQMAVGYCEESLLAEPILDQLSSATLSNQANRARSRSLSKISAFSIRVLPAD
ncbi:hypothetical protein Lpp122_2292 [Lacticaseibacillus paracasei subsp. paracasei Lpp122]|uniref:Uncharacterized protein n=1 Tax=Lacticaseibacillus paracasei subsp. paracasei Lpp122 TaxID=1256218 RepID=A0A8E0I480_LACPA|nr:hypothetical protein Lpp122_2292 [Lacticaseibacillus paracasei subsp. paracasei Lpp122]